MTAINFREPTAQVPHAIRVLAKAHSWIRTGAPKSEFGPHPVHERTFHAARGTEGRRDPNGKPISLIAKCAHGCGERIELVLASEDACDLDYAGQCPCCGEIYWCSTAK